ncbi:MAG: hypothetical protein KatS3mg119_0640 [Rhodothalassiaceae bacterium]|nr:MAG: hypothetical protein KatS3mg119_0640 [Rhodothalassiaceae bacterium]
MSATGLEVFDETVQKTNIWLKEIMEELGLSRRRAYEVLRAVLQSLRDRLTVDEAAHLSAQLPMLVRGIFFEGWHPAGTPHKWRSLDEFLAEVRAHMGSADVADIDLEEAARAVFGVIARHVSAGEVADVRQSLPEPVRRLWPEAAPAA